VIRRTRCRPHLMTQVRFWRRRIAYLHEVFWVTASVLTPAVRFQIGFSRRRGGLPVVAQTVQSARFCFGWSERRLVAPEWLEFFARVGRIAAVRARTRAGAAVRSSAIRCPASRDNILSPRGVRCRITCLRSAFDRSLRNNWACSSRFTISTAL